MDTISALIDIQLTEREAMTYLIVESGKLSLRQLGDILGTSHQGVNRVYDRAKQKIEHLSSLGLYQTPVDKSEKKH